VERYCEEIWNSQVLNENAIVVCRRTHLLHVEVGDNAAREQGLQSVSRNSECE
jgi:hypothetical protein